MGMVTKNAFVLIGISAIINSSTAQQLNSSTAQQLNSSTAQQLL